MSVPPVYSHSFLRCLLLSTVYFVGAGVLLMLFQNITHTQYLRREDCFLNWDAGHYYYLAHNPYQGFRVAFFPLFPFIWKLLGISSYGIVFFNGLLFIISTALLSSSLHFSAKEQLLMLTFPTLLFMFVPYSESVFFFCCTLALAGIKRDNNILVFIGMLLASLARPVVFVFVPAIAIMFYLAPGKLTMVKKILFYIVPVLLGLGIVMTIDYFSNGSFFAFFSAQKLWGNSYRLPVFPLTTWGGEDIKRLDGSAMLMGMLATAALCVMAYKRLKNKGLQEDNTLVFSLLYLAGICWIILFTRGGSLFSLNRFVYATPFFFVAMVGAIRRTWSLKEYAILFFCINAFWLCLGSYVHIQVILKDAALSLFLLCFTLTNHEKRYISVPALIICVAANVFMQIYFYNYFLDTCWVA